MSDQAFYEFLVWSVKVAGAVILLLIIAIAAARKFTPTFPESDAGERGGGPKKNAPGCGRRPGAGGGWSPPPATSIHEVEQWNGYRSGFL